MAEGEGVAATFVSEGSAVFDPEQIQSVEEADALLELEQTELERLKHALHSQQRKLELIRQRRDELAEDVRANRTSVDVSQSTKPASEFVISKDDDEDDDVPLRSPKSADDDFDLPLESIGVAKCGRCGAKLPLDLEAIDAHTIECERNFAVGLAPMGKRNSGVHYLVAVKASIADFIKNPGTDATTEEDLFLVWLRKFHAEMSDEEFAENSEKLVEGFRAIWKEVWSVGEAPECKSSRAVAKQSSESQNLREMAPGVMRCTPKDDCANANDGV